MPARRVILTPIDGDGEPLFVRPFETYAEALAWARWTVRVWPCTARIEVVK